MELLQSRYNIHSSDFDASEFDANKCYLWILNANKIPPHIGISFESKYFSLKASGIDQDIDLDSIINLIVQKNIPTLAVEVKGEQEGLGKVFSAYTKTIPFEITCLNPIKEHFKLLSSNTIHDLLAELFEQGKLVEATRINLSNEFLWIPDYTLSDIHKHLRNLE